MSRVSEPIASGANAKEPRRFRVEALWIPAAGLLEQLARWLSSGLFAESVDADEAGGAREPSGWVALATQIR